MRIRAYPVRCARYWCNCRANLDTLQSQIEQIDEAVVKVAGEDEACRRLMTIPGVGSITATAVVAAIANGVEFSKGRAFATWLGLVPGQYSTGGKEKLLGISKRGNSYLRRLFVHGARAVLQRSENQAPGLRAWLVKLSARAHKNVVAVALANKLARIAWAVLTKGEFYRPALLGGEDLRSQPVCN